MWNPLGLAAKNNASNNPRYHEVMNGTDTAGYWESMKSEATTFIKLKPVHWYHKIQIRIS